MTQNINAIASILNINTKENSMSECTVKGCEHTKICGRDALVEFEAIRRGKTVCSVRKAFVEHAYLSFAEFYEQKNGNFEQYSYEVIADHFEENIGEVTVDEIRASQEGDSQLQSHMEEQLHERRLAYKADTAGRSIQDRLEYAYTRLRANEEELKLLDIVQDWIDHVSSITPEWKSKKMARATKKRLDQLLAEKKMSWSNFVVMANQCHTILGWKEINLKEEARFAADAIGYWEKKIESLHKLAADQEGMVYETSLDKLDTDMSSDWE